MRPLPIVVAILVSMVSLGCATPQTRVVAKAEPGVNFRELRTFAFAPVERMDTTGSQMADPVTRTRIEAAIGERLRAKGLTSVSLESGPDLLVSYFADVFEGPVEGSRQVDNWERQGKITVEVIDAKALTVLWRGDGWALNPNGPLAEKVITDVMEKYP